MSGFVHARRSARQTQVPVVLIADALADTVGDSIKSLASQARAAEDHGRWCGIASTCCRGRELGNVCTQLSSSVPSTLSGGRNAELSLESAP